METKGFFCKFVVKRLKDTIDERKNKLKYAHWTQTLCLCSVDYTVGWSDLVLCDFRQAQCQHSGRLYRHLVGMIID